jgi:hypothetical protein
MLDIALAGGGMQMSPWQAAAYGVGMCIGCAMAAASAATGFRTWLQTHHLGWLTPRRLKALTLTAICAAVLVSSTALTGSTTPTATGMRAGSEPVSAPTR